MRETLNPDPAMVAVHHQAATEEVQAVQEGLVEDDVKLRSIQKT